MIHSSAAFIFTKFPLLPFISLVGISLCFLSISLLPRPRCALAGEPLRRKTDVSHILFGIGGSAATWSRRARYCESWWKPNVTRGYVWLDVAPTGKWPESSPDYRVSADTAGFRYTNPGGSRSAVRIARIVKESFDHGERDVRWFAMGDDDTVFFPENLAAVLGKYDHGEMHYVGGISESVEQNLAHSYNMAYGGGGFAVSYALAAALVGILDGCIDRYAAFYGSDHKIAACVHEIGVPLTIELGFHQMDIRGSPYGLLTAHPLAPLVSLHHLDHILPIFPETGRIQSLEKLIRSYDSDPSRILQQSFFYDPTRNWSVSVSWGYSVQLYPFLVAAADLTAPLRTFATWGTWSQSPFAFDTRAYGESACERPFTFHVDRVEGRADGTASFYGRRRRRKGSADHAHECGGDNYASAAAVKGFNVTAAVMNPAIWSKAVRRQCCEVAGEMNGVIHLSIRDCNAGESTTPP